MINTAIAQTKSRKHFFRNIYQKELTVLMVFLAAPILLIAMIMYNFIFTQQKPPDFYASSSDGILMPLKPVLSPNLSNKPLIE